MLLFFVFLEMEIKIRKVSHYVFKNRMLTVRVPKATDGGVRVTAGASAPATVSVSALVPVPPALVALSVMLLVPTAVGVPVIAPVAVLMANPAGSPVAL